jgi:hypothetical protein
MVGLCRVDTGNTGEVGGGSASYGGGYRVAEDSAASIRGTPSAASVEEVRAARSIEQLVNLWQTRRNFRGVGAALHKAHGDRLMSVVLYGSAAIPGSKDSFRTSIFFVY